MFSPKAVSPQASSRTAALQRPALTTTLRIPGPWVDGEALAERLPANYRLEPTELITPDGRRLSLTLSAPDRRFPSVFRRACRGTPQAAELEVVRRHLRLAYLTGPSGSLGAAQNLLTAGGALIRAGGGGVFIDNSALSHGGRDWLIMDQAQSSDAISYAFVNTCSGSQDLWTLGMRNLGLPDLIIRKGVGVEGQELLIQTLRYMAAGDKPVADGHYVTNEFGPLYQVLAGGPDPHPIHSPLHNPLGRLQLKRVAQNLPSARPR